MKTVCKCGFDPNICPKIDANHCPFADKGNKGPRKNLMHVPKGQGVRRRRRKKPKCGVPKAIRNENRLKSQKQ